MARSAVEGEAEGGAGFAVFGEAGEDVGVVVLDFEEGDAELFGEFFGEGGGVVAGVEVAGDELGADAQKAGKEVGAVFEGEDGAEVGGVADVGGGVEEGAAGEGEGVFEFGADREGLGVGAREGGSGAL